MVCKNCGAKYSEQVSFFCPNCGTCTENAKFCKYCGAVIGADCVVCPACGRQVEPLQSAQQPQPVYVTTMSLTAVWQKANGQRFSCVCF